MDGNGSIDNPYDVNNSNFNWVDEMLPGDIYYFRDGQAYDGKYNGGKSVIWIRDSEPSGTESSPIAFLAYPGELPIFSLPEVNVNYNSGIKFSNNYMVFSGFNIDSQWQGASMAGDFNRFAGNDVAGLKILFGSGTGIVTSGNSTTHTGDGNIFLGNALHGGNSQSRYDHGLYLSGCSDNGGAEVGWNHFYDNNFGRGPIIVVNHQGDRCDANQVLDAHFIFNNIVDCSAQRSRAIGIYDLSYDDGEEEPEPTYVYNNVIISCGTFDGENTKHIGWAPAMYQSARGSAHFYNNTFYNAGYTGFSINEKTTKSSFKNNILHMSPDVLGPTGNHYIRLDEESVVSLSNNLYFGLDDYVTCDNCAIDQNNLINADPLFVDAANFDFRLSSGSPAIQWGSDNLEFEVDPPSYAPINRDLNFVLRSEVPSLGAYEIASVISNTKTLDSQIDVVVFPNPADNNFTLQFDLGVSTSLHIEIFDGMGKLVLQNEPVNYSAGLHYVNFDLTKLSTGIYYLKLFSDGGKSTVRKFILK